MTTVLPALLSDSWMDNGKCQGTDANFFHPYRGDNAGVAAAKDFCGDCPVRDACLDWAVRTNQKVGVYGGTSARERRRLRRVMFADLDARRVQCGMVEMFDGGCRCPKCVLGDRARRHGRRPPRDLPGYLMAVARGVD